MGEQGDQMHRLFVGIRPPADIRDRLIDTMEAVEDARWQGEDQLHLTLRFIGEVDTPCANDLAAALARIEMPDFTLALDGVGHFERKGVPRAIWAGLSDSPELRRLRAKVERACQEAGLEPETRRFHPHVTLARLGRSSGDIVEWTARNARLSSEPFPVEAFILFESELTRQGSVYRAVSRYPLAQKA